MKTIDYYNQYADQFVQATLYVDMESLYQPFLAELPDSARILDLGCGSGCDTLAFKNRGYQVDGIDYSEVLVKRNEYLIASHHPLRETLIAQIGFTEPARRGFLQDAYNCATLTMGGGKKWEPSSHGVRVF